MKKLVNYSTGLLLVTISLAGIGNFMFAGAVPANVRVVKHHVSRMTKGGVVVNHTSSSITISSDSYIGYLPPGKNSIEVGIIDTDAVVIDRPMIFEDKSINNKVLKFCNLATIEVTENTKKEIIIKDKKLSWVCRLVDDYAIYDTIKKAFHQE